MSDIFVEQQDDGTYEATQNRRVIARGDTQRQTVDRARRVKPDDPVLAERVRNTEVGGRDNNPAQRGGLDGKKNSGRRRSLFPLTPFIELIRSYARNRVIVRQHAEKNLQHRCGPIGRGRLQIQ
jgi:hypothetical protein